MKRPGLFATETRVFKALGDVPQLSPGFRHLVSVDSGPSLIKTRLLFAKEIRVAHMWICFGGKCACSRFLRFPDFTPALKVVAP